MKTLKWSLIVAIILQLLFIDLKVFSFVSWSWWVVLVPLWLFIAGVVFILCVMAYASVKIMEEEERDY